MVIVTACSKCGLLYDPNISIVECTVCKAPVFEIRLG